MSGVLRVLGILLYCTLPQLGFVATVHAGGRATTQGMRVLKGVMGLAVSAVLAGSLYYLVHGEMPTREMLGLVLPRKPLLSVSQTVVMAHALVSENVLVAVTGLVRGRKWRAFVRRLPWSVLGHAQRHYVDYIVAPAIEEVVFRGLLVHLCDRWWKALLFSSVFFAGHLANMATSAVLLYRARRLKAERESAGEALPDGLSPVPNIRRALLDGKAIVLEVLDKLYTLLFGLWCFFVARRTGSILCSTAAHAICNVFGAPVVRELRYPASFIASLALFGLTCVWFSHGVRGAVETRDVLYITLMNLLAYAGVVYVEENTVIFHTS